MVMERFSYFPESGERGIRKLDSNFEVTTKVFDLVSPEKLAEVTGLSLDIVRRVHSGGIVTEEFISAVLTYFYTEPYDRLFTFKVVDAE
jgi:hypothetical protein